MAGVLDRGGLGARAGCSNIRGMYEGVFGG